MPEVPSDRPVVTDYGAEVGSPLDAATLQLTARQAQVLAVCRALEATGRYWTLTEAGDRLGITGKAVRSHLLAIARKREHA